MSAGAAWLWGLYCFGIGLGLGVALQRKLASRPRRNGDVPARRMPPGYPGSDA